MAAPTVQNLADIIASIEPAFAPQKQVIGQQIATLPGQEAAAQSGLDAAKTNAFRDINTGANTKGVAFSGVPIAEQSRYLGEKYLPAVAALKTNTQNQQFSLQQALAQLASQEQLKAFDIQGGQQSSLDAYNLEQQKQAFQAQQAELDRQVERAKISASNAGLSPVQQKQQDVGAAHSFLQSVVGSDNYVSPTTYSQAKSLWVSLGYAPQEFDQQFASYRNPSNKYYKLG